MTPQDLAAALLAAPAAASRQALLIPRDDEFYVSVTGLLKDRVDDERLRDPGAALRMADIAAEVADYADNHRCRALAAWARGNVLIHQGDYQACLRLYQQAARFFADEGAEIESARLTANQAWVYKNLGRYEEGIRAARAALNVLQQHPPSIFMASAYNALGVLYRLSGEFGAALDAFAQCEQTYSALGEQVRRARALINKANLLETLDRFEEALTLLTRARAVLAGRERWLEVARADLNLGILNTRLGRYDQALGALNRAETGFASLANKVEAAVVSLYRADLYAEFNLYDELLQTSAHDWQLFDERQMQWQAARALLHRAVAWRRLGEPLRARDLLTHARAAFDRIGDPIWVQMTRLEQAALDCELDEWASALPVAAEAAAFFRSRGMPLRAAVGLLLVARCCLALDRLAEAAERYREAAALAEEGGAPSLLYRAQHGLGRVAERQGRLEAAYEHYRQAVDLVEGLRQRLQVEDYRLGFFKDKLEVYRDAALLCLRLDREEDAFAFVERAKSGALVDLLIASLGERPPSAGEAVAPLLKRLSALREELNWHYSKFDVEQDQARGSAWPQSEAEVKQRISGIEREVSRVWRQLQELEPFYGSVGRPEMCTPASIQRALRQDEALVQYFEAGDRLYAFVLSAEGFRACLPLSCVASQLRDAVDALDATLRGVPGFSGEYVTGTLGPLSRQQLGWLYEDLIAPIMPHIDGVCRLLIAPDGVLFDVPFHALWDGYRYLLERFEIVHVPSAGTLRLCRENLRRHDRGGSNALLVGYAEGQALPYIEREIEAVARVVPGATVLTDGDAVLAHVQDHAAESALVHLATHAVFRSDNPLFSALQLAGGEWLRVMDFYRLRLNGALVTLSGCETGRHRLVGGDILGLSRGFFYAGAAALVVSLWPVEDRSTAILMEQFYSHLMAGETAASALGRAQQALRTFEIEQGRPYAHPFYWAPFCLLGAPDVRLVQKG